jgi:hypothetical protein
MRGDWLGTHQTLRTDRSWAARCNYRRASATDRGALASVTPSIEHVGSLERDLSATSSNSVGPFAGAHLDHATEIPQPIEFVGLPPHHSRALLPEFGGMGVGAADFVRLLGRPATEVATDRKPPTVGLVERPTKPIDGSDF